MKQQNVVAYVLRLTVTLLLICGVVAGVLAGVNAITVDAIAANQARKTQQALQVVLPGVTGLEEVALTGDTGSVTALYASGDNYAVQVAPVGFDGEITMMVGISGGKVTGISVISHTETPGLGAVSAADNAKGEAFRGQFVGAEDTLAVNKDGGTIDALTGATITSRAVVAGVNAALDYIKTLG